MTKFDKVTNQQCAETLLHLLHWYIDDRHFGTWTKRVRHGQCCDSTIFRHFDPFIGHYGTQTTDFWVQYTNWSNRYIIC